LLAKGEGRLANTFPHRVRAFLSELSCSNYQLRTDIKEEVESALRASLSNYFFLDTRP